MGASKFNLNQIDLNKSEEIYLMLTDPARPLKDLGEIKIVVTLTPKTQEDKEQVKNCHLSQIFPVFTACERLFL